MKTLSKSEFLAAKLAGMDVSCVWSKELKKLLKEKDDLFEQNTIMRMKLIALEEENAKLENALDGFHFVRLYA